MNDSTQWVQIELPNRPDGLRIATPLGRPCRVVAFPRRVFHKLRRNKTLAPHPLERQGVYVLRGPRGEGEPPEMYVGRAEPRPVGRRLDEHAKNKEKRFWKETYVITTSSPDWRVPVSFVEARLIELLKESGKAIADQRDENIPELTRMEEAAAQDFLNDVILCLRALGVFEFDADDPSPSGTLSNSSVFSPPAPKVKDDPDAPDSAELRLTSLTDVRAYAREPHLGNFIVLPGSTVRETVKSRFRSDYPDLMALREDLIQEGIIKSTSGKLRFQEEYSFDSELTAKRVILGHQGRGKGNSWQLLD